MKHLPKHLQPRWRYLAVEIETHPKEDISRDAFQTALWQAARALVGDAGSATIGLTVVRFRQYDGGNEAVVRCYRGTVDRARAVIACVDRVGSTPIGVRVRGTSGTIRACEEKYLGRAHVKTEERTVVFDGEERTAVVRSPRVDLRDDSTFVGATDLDFQHK